MQAAIGLPAVLPVAAMGSRLAARRRSIVAAGTRRLAGGVVRAAPTGAVEVDYSSDVSVFPMEACDLVGGEACEAAEMYPETKLGDSASAAAASKVEEVEREYLSYDEAKTVFPGEACDDLGGEFCEAPYQTGVSKE
ncbi:light-regulated protein, chloroplastic-like [Lolium rigidum]|uniref:light-regulated protein, chloroplastic-like n=1 Tax=Lolium rigidum TaxID=89674 RepID=UPI001F5C4FC6|nr:light-regulated protein, chloroplastic-like [Lolium rigidum]